MNCLNPCDFKVGDILQSKEWGNFKIIEYRSARYITIEFLNTGNVYVRQKGNILRGSVSDRSTISKNVEFTKDKTTYKKDSFFVFMSKWNPITHKKDVYKLPYFSYCKDFGWVYKGFTYVDAYTYKFASNLKWVKNGYVRLSLSKSNCELLGIQKPKGRVYIPLHSWVKAMPTGVKSLMTDHINGCKLDNRPHNLRIANSSQNSANSKTNSKFGYKGVKVLKCSSKGKKVKNVAAQGYVPYSNKHKFLGNYYTIHDAAKAVDIWNIQTYGEFARLNLKRSIYEDMGLLVKKEKKYRLP